MRKFSRVILLFGLLLMVVTNSMYAQETEVAEEEESPFSIGVDLVSSYVWRGSRQLGGPALQPTVEFSTGGLAIGAWGSFGLLDTDGATTNEADLYVSYGFDFGLSLGLSDYYYQGSDYADYEGDDASHGFEINAGFETGDFSIGANYILNDTKNGAGTQGGDMYFELGYGFKSFSVFVGAGDGWHTSDTEFDFCNIGLSTSKELKISDKFSLPVSGMICVNPDKGEFNIVGTISF
jgi:uncharacterized protein (TIGR02001 family)